MRKAIFESIASGMPKPPSYNAAVDEAYPKASPPSFPQAQHHQESNYPPPPGPPPSNHAGGSQPSPSSGSAQPKYPPPPGPPPGSQQGATSPAWGSRTYILLDHVRARPLTKTSYIQAIHTRRLWLFVPILESTLRHLSV